MSATHVCGYITMSYNSILHDHFYCCIQKYEVEGILNKDGEHQYLVRWAEDYKPSWQPAITLEKDCPLVVAAFRDVCAHGVQVECN